MNPKVSIVTVVYNDVKNIEKTILNTLSQTYEQIEFIVVDGASTDGTIDIIRKYSKHIKWISEKDKGIYDAMNKGAQMATGEWILFHNCGDFFVNSNALVDFFSEIKESEDVTFLIGDIRCFNNYGYKDKKPYILTNTYYEGMPVNHPATFNRTKWQQENPFNVDFKNSGDYDFYVRSFLKGATYLYIEKKLVLMDHRQGATVDNCQNRLRENLKILKEYNAPHEQIMLVSEQLRHQQKVDKLCHLFPFLTVIRKFRTKLNYSNTGWIKADIYSMLESI